MYIRRTIIPGLVEEKLQKKVKNENLNLRNNQKKNKFLLTINKNLLWGF
jgi:hypothetical protein